MIEIRTKGTIIAALAAFSSLSLGGVTMLMYLPPLSFRFLSQTQPMTIVGPPGGDRTGDAVVIATALISLGGTVFTGLMAFLLARFNAASRIQDERQRVATEKSREAIQRILEIQHLLNSGMANVADSVERRTARIQAAQALVARQLADVTGVCKYESSSREHEEGLINNEVEEQIRHQQSSGERPAVGKDAPPPIPIPEGGAPCPDEKP
jgi:hypothetical protein